MRCMKFVHCADIHLDAPFISLGIKDDNSFMSVSKSAIRRMDLKNTFKNIMEIARDEGAGYIFISGDLYEHNYVRKSTINYVNGIFKSLGNYKIKIFIVPGNHDPWVKGSYYTDFEWAGNVYILAGDKTHVCFEEEGICIYSPGAFPGIFTEGGNFDVERAPSTGILSTGIMLNGILSNGILLILLTGILSNGTMPTGILLNSIVSAGILLTRILLTYYYYMEHWTGIPAIRAVSARALTTLYPAGSLNCWGWIILRWAIFINGRTLSGTQALYIILEALSPSGLTNRESMGYMLEI